MHFPCAAITFTTTVMKHQTVAMADLCIEMESSTAAMACLSTEMKTQTAEMEV